MVSVSIDASSDSFLETHLVWFIFDFFYFNFLSGGIVSLVILDGAFLIG